MTTRILLLLAVVAAIPVLAQPATGAVRVLVTDEVKAVIPGAGIVLDGPVQRQGVTDPEGLIVIDQLPAGSYQLRALLHGFMEEQVSLKVVAGLTTAQRITLRLGTTRMPGYTKPVREIVTTGCRHGDPPTSLESLVGQVDAVADVLVIEQHAEDRVPPQAVSPVVITRNAVEVLAVFKAHPRWFAPLNRGEVRQQGGDVDRGDYIEVVRQNCLDPLIVGREYVLFLEQSDWLGGWGVFFDGEGALLVDGSRLVPLGAGEFAQSWRSRLTADLFAALAKLRR